MNTLRLALCAVLCLLTLRSTADPTVTFSPPTNDDGTPSGYATIELVNGKWNFWITKAYVEQISPFTVTIGAGQDEPIRIIQIDQGAYPTSNVIHVRGRTQYQQCGSVDKIEAVGWNTISLVELWMIGDLGAGLSAGQPVIEGFDRVGGMDITGNVYGDIITLDDSQNSIYEVKGDVYGHLIALDGYHRDIRIL